jgi:hypothetical protein
MTDKTRQLVMDSLRRLRGTIIGIMTTGTSLCGSRLDTKGFISWRVDVARTIIADLAELTKAQPGSPTVNELLKHLACTLSAVAGPFEIFTTLAHRTQNEVESAVASLLQCYREIQKPINDLANVLGVPPQDEIPGSDQARAHTGKVIQSLPQVFHHLHASAIQD